MKNKILDVITVISNPRKWKSRIALYKKFEQHMLESPNVRLTVVECAIGERDFEIELHPGINNIRVRAKSQIWNKENLINIGISRLTPDWNYVAWIDADVTFRDKNWAVKTLDALQIYDIVQPWDTCYDLGPNGEHLELHRSFCKLFHDGKPIGAKAKGPYTFAHPGYAWAATRRAIDLLGGIFEQAYLGAGDHHMALSFVGQADYSVPGGVHPNYKANVMAWQKLAMQHINGNIGYVPGTIEHGWHGAKAKRAYIDRWTILTKHNFDPVTDVKKNWHGVVELIGNKPLLRRDIDKYFSQRCEDANSVD